MVINARRGASNTVRLPLLSGGAFGNSPEWIGSHRQQFTVHGRTAFPLSELDGPQPVAQPFAQLAPNFGCLRQPEVRLPSQQIGPQPLHHLLHATAARAACELPDPDLEVAQSFVGHRAFHFSAFGHPLHAWSVSSSIRLVTCVASHTLVVSPSMEINSHEADEQVDVEMTKRISQVVVVVSH